MEKEDRIREWALSQVGSPYVYGATGKPCTPGERQARLMQYPMQSANIKAACPRLSGRQNSCLGCPHQGQMCYDCAQFVKKAFEQVDIQLPSGASSQWLCKAWSKKGAYTQEAKKKLCVLFKKSDDPDHPMSHVGLSLGDGRVVDARNHARGVVISDIDTYPWTHYARVDLRELAPKIKKEEEKENMQEDKGQIMPPAEILPGDSGEAVLALQRLLMDKGFPLARYGADGKFGKETKSALNEAQKALGLPKKDGADEAFLQALESTDAHKRRTFNTLKELSLRLDTLSVDIAILEAEIQQMAWLEELRG